MNKTTRHDFFTQCAYGMEHDALVPCVTIKEALERPRNTDAAAPVSLPAPKLADALRFAIQFIDYFPADSWLDDPDEIARHDAAVENARAALREYDAAESNVGEGP